MTCPNQSEVKPKRPVVHYHGGKWRIAKWVISQFPQHRCYVEPFGGGASVLLRKDRSKVEVYNDLDDEIVNVFKTARSNQAALIRQLELTPYSRAEFAAAYQPGGTAVERARKTIVKAFMGFGGNGIYHRTGFRATASSNTGPEKSWDSYPDNLRQVVERFKNVVIENRTAAEVMRQYDGVDTLHYVDPPYLPSTRDAGKDYRHELVEGDHVELSRLLHELSGNVVLSGYPDPLYDRLYKGWKRVDRETRCASTAIRTECLWIKQA